MTASPIIELCTLLLPDDVFGALSDVSGATNSPNVAGSAVGGAGAAGAAGAGGAPGDGGGGDGGGDGGDGDGDGGGGDSDSKPRKRTLRERLFGGEKAVEDVAQGAAEDLIINGVLTKAGGGAMGVVPSLISAGVLLAEGSVTIMKSEGNGLGGINDGVKSDAVESRRSPDGTYHPDDVAAGRAPGGSKK